MELWFVFIVVLVAGLGIFAMLGYVKNETDKMELKHLLVAEQFRRQIAELESERAADVTRADETIADLRRQVEDLQETNGQLQVSLDKARRGGLEGSASEPASSSALR